MNDDEKFFNRKPPKRPYIFPVDFVGGSGLTDKYDNMNQIDPVIEAREKVWKEYCVKKGWPLEPDKLSMEQILEIRGLPEWKNPVKSKEE